MNQFNQGRFSLKDFMFSANLKEFSQRINYVCLLLAYGEMSSEQAEQEIESLYQQLQHSAVTLGIKKSEF
ncbi:MAG: hypothetical protein Kow00121_64610 [Elainellaceae cyanobacterium]